MQTLPTEDHELRIERVLGVVYRRNGYEIPDNRTPLDELIAAEDGDDEELRAEVMSESFNGLLDYFFADGPHPGAVMRRVYAVAWALKPGLTGDMTQADMARMFDETRAAMSWRVKKIFEGYLASKGFRGCKAPGQKSSEACAKYAIAAQGNRNRRGK